MGALSVAVCVEAGFGGVCLFGNYRVVFRWSVGETFLSYFLVLLSGEKLTHSVTVSTKIPKQLKEKIVRFKIKPSKILRKALEDEVKKREVEELKQEITNLKPLLEKVSIDEIVKSIREDRERGTQ